MSEPHPPTLAEKAAAKARASLGMVCATLPYLSGLANAVRLQADARVATAAVTRGGRVLVNPTWFNALDLSEATFVMAHELLHLCLQTHERGAGTNPVLFNVAHDYIINDILTEELGRRPPKGGLEYPGARQMSAELLVTMLKSGQIPSICVPARSTMRAALEDAGLLPAALPNGGPGTGDVMGDDEERALFPAADAALEVRHRNEISVMSAKAQSLAALKERLDAADRMPAAPNTTPSDEVAIAEALRAHYAPPWELALQQWMEAATPGPRSYARASRRAASNPDVVLAGRQRAGWMLHIVLDTSGSMVDQIPRVLGLIAMFCESVGVERVHVLQCDQAVTVDEYIEPENLASYKVAGFGGSDMSPAMLRLADDPEVQAAIVITDGAITYPASPMPYEVLWAITDPTLDQASRPPYGHVVLIPPDRQPP